MAARSFPHWIPWWLILVAGVAGAAAVGIFQPVPDPVEVYLPGEAVVTEVIPQSLLDQLAAERALNGDLTMANGRLKDENSRLLKIVEALQIKTGPVPSPEPEIVERIVYRICDEQLPPLGRASLEAFKFEGLTATGDLSHGWTGWIRCEIAPSDASEWAVLVEEPFTLANTRSAAAAPPEAHRRPQRWYVGTQYAILENGMPFDYQEYPSISRFRLYGGRKWLPLKRLSVATGVFVEQDAAGFDLRVDF